MWPTITTERKKKEEREREGAITNRKIAGEIIIASV